MQGVPIFLYRFPLFNAQVANLCFFIEQKKKVRQRRNTYVLYFHVIFCLSRRFFLGQGK